MNITTERAKRKLHKPVSSNSIKLHIVLYYYYIMSDPSPKTYFIDVDGTIVANKTDEELEVMSKNPSEVQELLPNVNISLHCRDLWCIRICRNACRSTVAYDRSCFAKTEYFRHNRG